MSLHNWSYIFDSFFCLIRIVNQLFMPPIALNFLQKQWNRGMFKILHLIIPSF